MERFCTSPPVAAQRDDPAYGARNGFTDGRPILPLFVAEGEGIKREVPSMPGVYQLSLDHLAEELHEIKQLGIPSVMFFGIPAHKDDVGSEAYREDGIVQQAIRLAKETEPELYVMADTCLCEYTDHGHVVSSGITMWTTMNR